MAAVVAKKYELIRPLGSGGLGAVFEARHLTLQRRVAIKHLHRRYRDDAEMSARFIREAQAAAAIDHPGIVAVLDVDDDESLGPVVVLELLSGEPLDTMLKRGALAWDRACRLMVQALEGVAAAHQHGVTHRDLKPANLFVVRDGDHERVKVLDFGIAKVDASPALTVAGDFIGTPRYASPEQRLDSSSADARSDLYSLGVTLLEMVTGTASRLTADGSEREKTFAALRSKGLPEGLCAVIERATAPDRAARFPDAASMRSALVAVLEQQGAPLDAPAPPQPQPQPQPDARADNDLARAQTAAAGGASASETAATRPARGPDAAPSAREAPNAVPPGATESEPSIVAATRTFGPTDAAGTPRARSRSVFVVAASIVVVALVGTVLATRWHHHDPTRPSVHGVSPANRAALQHVCRGWSAALLATQSPDGSFRGDPHRLASGWDTGQAITGLLAMSGGCNAVDPEPLLRGTRALWNQKRATGWSIDPTPAPTGEASAPATAWATLAFAASARLDGTADASAHALAARDALLGFQQPDGGFDSRTTNEPGTSESAYATVLSLWALVDAEPVAPSPTAVEARRRASAWLRRALTDSTESHPVLSVPGLLEESVWVLLRARRAVGDRAPGDDRLIQSLARAVTARCALNLVDGARVCTRPLYADGSAYLAPPRGDSGTIVTNWFPWAVAAAKALRDDDTLQLPPAVQDDLSAMLEWGTREMSGSADALAAEPGYKLSEYAVALGSLL